MNSEFRAVFQARWADMDFNGHMRNTAYLDYAADTRMLFFKANGFRMSDFARLKIGPVVFTDTISYRRELTMYQEFTVTLELKGLSPDGARFCFENRFADPDGKTIATVRSDACWFDLEKRKVTPPPETIPAIMNSLRKTDDFECIGSACPDRPAVA